MLIRALAPFRDLAEGADRKTGDTWDATEERFAEIERKLPGFAESAEEEATAAEEEAPKPKRTARRTKKEAE